MHGMKPGFILVATVAAAALVASCSGQKRPAMQGAAQASLHADGASSAAMAMGALQQGRFAEAAAAQASILAQNPEDRRAQLGYALAQLGLGHTEQAVARLRALVADGGAADADVGLALALAGEAQEGVAVLEQAALRPDASLRTRQNLALALALADSWPRARALVEREVGPQQATWRLTQWAAWAALPPPHRLAGFLGVPPGSAAPVTLVEAATPPLPGAAGAPQASQLAAAALETHPAADATTTSPALADKPVALAAADAPVLPEPKPEPAASATGAREQAQPKARWVIQLAAYRNVAAFRPGWSRLQKAHEDLLGRYEPRLVAGAQADGWHRLTVGSFMARAEADAECRALRRAGVECFVRRPLAGDRNQPFKAQVAKTVTTADAQTAKASREAPAA